MLSTQRFLSRMAASRVHGVGGSGKRAGGKSFRARQLRLERLEERTVLSGGVVLTSIGPDTSDRAFAGFLQVGDPDNPADDKIVVAGDSSGDFAVLRYQADGTLDPTFGGGDGTVTTGFKSGSLGLASAAVPYGGDKILVGGFWDSVAAARDFALARYDADGNLDSQFGGKGANRGKVTTDVSGNATQDEMNALLVQPDGRIVAGGFTYGPDSVRQFALARYNPDGGLDPTFDGDGILTTPFPGIDAYVKALALHQGKILAVGNPGGGNGDFDFCLARYNIEDGSLDTTFGDGTGKVTTNITQNDYAFAAAVYPSGSPYEDYIVVGGETWVLGIPESFALARYHPDGTLDSTFGTDGTGTVVTSPFGHAGHVYALAIQPDGKIVAAGTTFTIARYNVDGTLDTYDDITPETAFGPDGSGLVRTPFPDYTQAQSVLIQSDGNIIVSGWTGGFGPNVIVLARYLPNGELDESFGVVPPSISIDDVTVTEGSSGTVDAVFTVTLSEALAAAVTVDFATANGTATAGSDYLAASGTLTFNPGEPLMQTIIVTVNGDTTKEANETFLVNLTNATGGAVISDGQGIGTIKNDDGGKPPKGSSAQLSAADLFFFNLSLNSEEDSDNTDPLASQAADELGLMLVQ